MHYSIKGIKQCIYLFLIQSNIVKHELLPLRFPVVKMVPDKHLRKRDPTGEPETKDSYYGFIVCHEQTIMIKCASSALHVWLGAHLKLETPIGQIDFKRVSLYIMELLNGWSIFRPISVILTGPNIGPLSIQNLSFFSNFVK